MSNPSKTPREPEISRGEDASGGKLKSPVIPLILPSVESVRSRSGPSLSSKSLPSTQVTGTMKSPKMMSPDSTTPADVGGPLSPKALSREERKLQEQIARIERMEREERRAREKEKEKQIRKRQQSVPGEDDDLKEDGYTVLEEGTRRDMEDKSRESSLAPRDDVESYAAFGLNVPGAESRAMTASSSGFFGDVEQSSSEESGRKRGFYGRGEGDEGSSSNFQSSSESLLLERVVVDDDDLNQELKRKASSELPRGQDSLLIKDDESQSEGHESLRGSFKKPKLEVDTSVGAPGGADLGGRTPLGDPLKPPLLPSTPSPMVRKLSLKDFLKKKKSSSTINLPSLSGNDGTGGEENTTTVSATSTPPPTSTPPLQGGNGMGESRVSSFLEMTGTTEEESLVGDSTQHSSSVTGGTDEGPSVP